MCSALNLVKLVIVVVAVVHGGCSPGKPARSNRASDISTPAGSPRLDPGRGKAQDEEPVAPTSPGSRRASANESATIGYMRTIVGSETAHYAAHQTYASLAMLANANPPFIATNLNIGITNNYTFQVEYTRNRFTCVATPVGAEEGDVAKFFTDESGVIRFTADGSMPNRESRAVGSS